jgi:hypothetical protein
MSLGTSYMVAQGFRPQFSTAASGSGLIATQINTLDKGLDKGLKETI